MNRLTQDSLHPMIKFRVVGYRIETAEPGTIAQRKPEPVAIEAKREYHIGLTYPHKPAYEGVLYETVEDIGANLPDDYMEAFRKSEYKDHVSFNTFQLHNCQHCNPISETVSIEKNLKDYTPLKYEKI